MTASASPIPSPILSLGLANAEKVRSPMQLALGRFRRNRLAMGGIVIVLIVFFMAVLASVISPFTLEDVSTCTDTTQNCAVGWIYAPVGSVDATTGKTNLLGTDNLGRDVLTRLFYGSRISLAVGIISESVVVLIGVPVGLIAGFFGGQVDNLLMRFTDIIYTFPDLLFVIIIVTVWGRSVWVIFVGLGLFAWVTMARLVRGQVMQIKQMDYVLGARSIGARQIGLMTRHILPNILSPIIVLVTLGIPGAIIAESTLTFLGVGIDPSTPTWGTMIDGARDAMQSYPTGVIFPAIAVAMLALAFTFVGDGVSDMLDPRRK
jgi:oligopeptide transport system permease protein